MISLPVRRLVGFTSVTVIALASGNAFAAAPIPTTFNPTVIQAMQALRGKTDLDLNAPTLLPNRQTGFLTAVTQASVGTYRVTLVDTKRPLHVNNRRISHDLVSAGVVATFGAIRLPSPLKAPGSPGYLTPLEKYNREWSGAKTGSPASLRVALGDHIDAVQYHVGTHIQLDWTEGEWTIQVAGRSMAAVEKAAPPVVHLLHTYFLPPFPGLYAVKLLDGGRTRVTSIDWMRGRVLSYINNRHASPSNPQATGRMAISWHRFTSSSQTASVATAPYAGTAWRFLRGRYVVPAVALGYHNLGQRLTFQPSKFIPVEGFAGSLHGRPFVLDFYAHYPEGLDVGINYNHHTVYFGHGPAPVFDVLNFTGNWVVLGAPSAGAYMAFNLVTGHSLVNTHQVVLMKGYQGLGTPSHVLGLSGSLISPNIPYPYRPS